MNRTSSRRPGLIVLIAATIAALIWGAVAFGAVYRWAYAPLAIAAAAIGLCGLIFSRAGRPPLGAMLLALVAIGLAMALQLVPLGSETLNRISPAATTFAGQYHSSYGVLQPAGGFEDATPRTSRQPISISPAHTIVGISLFVSLAILFLGTARLLSESGGLALARPLVAFGIVLSVVGIAQYTLTLHEMHPLIYGFWKPQSEAARPFGPFVNPNHFAGWMLMVLPVGLALFYEAVERMVRAAAGRKGDVVSVVSLPEFGQALLFGFAWAVMGLSLIMTRSRSALAALLAGSAIALWIVLRRQRSLLARAAVVGAFLVVLGGAGAWAGLDTLLGKALSGDQTNDSFGGRLRAWRDTRRIIEDFPLTGSGFNTYGTAMTIYQTGQHDVHFQEAHNDYLQLAAEGGLLLGIPILAALVIFVGQVRRRFAEAPKEGTTYWLRIGAVIGLVSIGLQSLFDFSLQMPGNAALFAVLAAIAVHQSPNLRRGGPTRSHDPSHADQRSGITAGAI